MEATKVSISCPQCGARYRIPDSVSAKKLQCKKCGGAIFLRVQGAFREKKGRNGSGAARPTGRYSRMVSARPVKMSAIHYLSALVTVALIAVIVRLAFF